jgi:hypothetical protein
MLWNTYPDELDYCTLQSAYEALQGDAPSSIPTIVWLMENPKSPFPLPGAIDLHGHDCMHLLLKQGFSDINEAYVVGFTMGNCSKLHPLHLSIFRFVAQYLYPHPYKIGKDELEFFEAGVSQGRSAPIKDICQLDFHGFKHMTLQQVRVILGLAKIVKRHQQKLQEFLPDREPELVAIA